MAWDDAPPTPSDLGTSGSWDSAPPTPEELKAPPTALESIVHGVVNNIPMGPQVASGLDTLAGKAGIQVPGLAENKPTYSENLAKNNRNMAAGKSAHPVAYGAGAVTGALAPLAIPGVGEAMEAAPLTTNGAIGAADAISNKDLTKDPLGTVKDAAVGAGIGALTNKIIKKIPTQEGLVNLANKKAIQSVEMPSGIVGAMNPEERTALGDFIQNNGLVGLDKSKVLQRARGLSETFGNKISEIAGEAEENGLTLDQKAHMDAINGLLEKAQQFKGSANREAKSLARDYTAGASDLVNLSDNPSWPEIQKLKEQYGKLAFNSKGEIKSEGAKDTYFALKDMLKGIAEKAQSNPHLAADYKQALAGYAQMQPIETGLERAVDSELRSGGSGMGVRGLAGIVKKLPGPLRAVAGPAAVALGHPMVGLAAALPELTDSALQSKVAKGAARVMPHIDKSVDKGLSQELIDFVIEKNRERERK